MLLALWSPKGGSGTSVLAAACALVLSRTRPTRLADLVGDQAAVLGLSSDPEPGLGDWLAAGVGAPADALDRLARDVTDGLALLGRGSVDPAIASAEAGAALAVCLRDAGTATVVDLGAGTTPVALAVGEVADATTAVVRGCYLALRRGVRSPMLVHTDAVAFVVEPGRSLAARDAADVLGVPVAAELPLRAAVARAVDAGVLPGRLPDPLARPARRLLSHVGIEGAEDAA